MVIYMNNLGGAVVSVSLQNGSVILSVTFSVYCSRVSSMYGTVLLTGIHSTVQARGYV